jgi:hypothetical protein
VKSYTPRRQAAARENTNVDGSEKALSGI